MIQTQPNTTNIRPDINPLLQALTYATKSYPQARKYFQPYEERGISDSQKLGQNNANETTLLWNMASTRHILNSYVERFSILQAHIKDADDPEVVIDSLRSGGRSDVAKQLTDLYKMADEEGGTIMLQSLQQFALFIMREQISTPDIEISPSSSMQTLLTKTHNATSFTTHSQLSTPEIGINPDGFIQTVWKVTNYGSLAMDFLPSDDVVFSILFNQDAFGGQQRRVSGVVSQHDIIRYVGGFTDMSRIGIEYQDISESFWQCMWTDESQPDNVISKLRDSGYDDLVEQLTGLSKMANEEGEDIVLQSLQQFALFIMRKQPSTPEIGINPDGFIQAIWQIPDYGSLAMDFLPSDDVVFSILFNQDAFGGQQRRVSGVVSQHDIIRYVGDFTKKLTV